MTAETFWPSIGKWIVSMVMWTPHVIKSAFVKSGIPRLFRRTFRPFAAHRNQVLERVAAIISERFYVVQTDWREQLEDHNLKPEFMEARNRARVRELNAILTQMQREFPSFPVDLAIDVFDVQSDVHSAVSARPQVQPITRGKAAAGGNP